MNVAFLQEMRDLVRDNWTGPPEKIVDTIINMIGGNPENAGSFAIGALVAYHFDEALSGQGSKEGRAKVHNIMVTVFEKLSPELREAFWEAMFGQLHSWDNRLTQVLGYRLIPNFAGELLAEFARRDYLPVGRVEKLVRTVKEVPQVSAFNTGIAVEAMREKLLKVPGVKEKMPFLTELWDEAVRLWKDLAQAMVKPHYVPIVEERDTTNPRCVKFGGVIPYLPESGAPMCRCGGGRMAHIASIYVGALPDEIKGLFREEDHDMLIRVALCTSCWIENNVTTFRGEELDRLCWAPDEVVNIGSPFNEPRVTTGFETVMSPPDYSLFNGELSDHPAVRKVADRSVIPFLLVSDVLELDHDGSTHAGGYPFYTQDSERPAEDSVLIFQFEESRASTGMWGDCGTAHLWLSQRDYGKLELTWACY